MTAYPAKPSQALVLTCLLLALTACSKAATQLLQAPAGITTEFSSSEMVASYQQLVGSSGFQKGVSTLGATTWGKMLEHAATQSAHATRIDNLVLTTVQGGNAEAFKALSSFKTVGEAFADSGWKSGMSISQQDLKQAVALLKDATEGANSRLFTKSERLLTAKLMMAALAVSAKRTQKASAGARLSLADGQAAAPAGPAVVPGPEAASTASGTENVYNFGDSLRDFFSFNGGRHGTLQCNLFSGCIDTAPPGQTYNPDHFAVKSGPAATSGAAGCQGGKLGYYNAQNTYVSCPTAGAAGTGGGAGGRPVYDTGAGGAGAGTGSSTIPADDPF